MTLYLEEKCIRGICLLSLGSADLRYHGFARYSGAHWPKFWGALQQAQIIWVQLRIDCAGGVLEDLCEYQLEPTPRTATQESPVECF